MSRFQKTSLLIGALIVVLLIALIAVTVLRQPGQSVVVTNTQVNATDAAHTYVAEFVATYPLTIQAAQTSIWQTATANAPPNP